MSTVNAVTIFVDNLKTSNVVAGNASSNISIIADDVSILFGDNLSINTSAIEITNISAPIYTTSINTTTISTSKIIINGVEYNSLAPADPGVNYQVFNSPIAANYWYKPSWATDNDVVNIMMWGGGGGAAGNSSGFMLGGGGGACMVYSLPAGQCNDVCNVVVGAGGVGATTTAAATNGSPSVFYPNSTYSITVYGGGAANGTGTTGTGGGGGGIFGPPSNTVGGAPLGGAVGNSSTFGGGGGSNNTILAAGDSIYGGGGGSAAGGTAGVSAGNSVYGGGGGGNSGISVFGGNGGTVLSTTTAIDGSAPGGGGGANTTTGGSGGRGEVRIWVTPSVIGGSTTTFYSIAPNTNYVTAGQPVQFTISTIGVSDGTTLYYTLNNSSTANSLTFSPTAVNGSVVINGGTNSFNLTPNTTSGSKAFYMDLRLVSTSGTIATGSANVNIDPIANQQVFTTNGNFVVPTGVTNVSIVAVGGGGGGANSSTSGDAGGGGALSYTNYIVVTPGETLTVNVAIGGTELSRTGGDSFVKRGSTVLILAKGAAANVGGLASGGTGSVRQSGGNGGLGLGSGGGGGGAAGYSGSGGAGADGGGSGTSGSSGSGGGGGGGGSDKNSGESGGGVGLLGEGASGAGGASGQSGRGGSGGANGAGQSNGGLYGGGGGGEAGGGWIGAGANGAVRIIWGRNRAYPATNTNDY
jgi:hypothetical protein